MQVELKIQRHKNDFLPNICENKSFKHFDVSQKKIQLIFLCNTEH